LREVLTASGFEEVDVDLDKADIPKETKILFMCSPQNDIHTSPDDSAVTEYTRISNYLNSYGSMVVIGSPETPDLPVLDEILASWGMKLVRNQTIQDNTNSHTQSNTMLYVDYVKSDSIVGNITNYFHQLSSPPKTLSISSAPIEVLNKGNGDTSIVEPVLQSSANSYVEFKGEGGETDIKEGPYNVMALSTRFTYVDNADTYSQLLLIGSEYFTETNTLRAQFGNTQVVYNILRLLSHEEFAMPENYKVIEENTIVMDKGQVYVYGVITSAVIPLIVAAAGVVVYVKRKHR
jgi:hypothetical protein